MNYGVTSDAKILSDTERAVSGLFGVLGITMIGGSIPKLMRSRKFLSLMESFSVIAKYLPEKIAEFTRSGGTMPE